MKTRIHLQATEDEQFDTLAVETEDSLEEQTADSYETKMKTTFLRSIRARSVKDIVRMHQEAERAIGKQGSEVGELRSSRRLTFAPKPSHNKPLKSRKKRSFLTDPQSSFAKAIEKHPKVRQAEAMATRMKQAESLATLKATHPDFYEDLYKIPRFE
jgi:hypothetical protein